MTQVATLLGVGTPETVRKWCRQAEARGKHFESHHHGWLHH